MARPLMFFGPIHCHFTSLKGEAAAIVSCCANPFSLSAGSVLTTTWEAADPGACAARWMAPMSVRPRTVVAARTGRMRVCRERNAMKPPYIRIVLRVGETPLDLAES